MNQHQNSINLSTESTKAPDDFAKSEGKALLKEHTKAIGALQEKLLAQSRYSLLVILQGMDASGKDGTVRDVFKRVSPSGIRVYSFKKPTKLEFAHDFLWRVHQQAPEKGMIQIFNRSHYEDVLVVKVREFAPAEAVEQRYDQINAFEKHLTENGVTIL
ncbi:MAG: polyphosphate kinase 2 family protein, partial [Bacteroidota bacterium]